jgi:hypothetical protein
MSYQHQVEFIQGILVKDSDLDHVNAKVAIAFYLLSNQQAKVSKQQYFSCVKFVRVICTRLLAVK